MGMAIFKDGGPGHSDRSLWDRKRHRQLLEEAIKKNLGDIIAEENIIGQSKNKKFKIPVKGIKEYQFIYGQNADGAASGTGQEKKGQVIGKAGDPAQNAQGQGQAGNQPGEEIYETEITMDEIINYIFDQLKLPDMDRKKYGFIETEHRFKLLGFQRKGIPPRLAKKRTVIEKLKRTQAMRRELTEEEAASDENKRIPFREDDLRYRRVRDATQPRANAVVICIMDVSGSMDQTKKYLARSFYFLLYQFVRWRYEKVEVVFIAHTTEAREVSEWEFFHHGEIGGTAISSGYAKALEIIEERYNPAIWNIYAFHCSDGDNWAEDNDQALELAVKLCGVCNLFGYGEVATANQSWNVTILNHFEKNIQSDNFAVAVMSKQDDIWPAFKRILDRHTAAPGGAQP
jgi:sporulation protein YhbH